MPFCGHPVSSTSSAGPDQGGESGSSEKEQGSSGKSQEQGSESASSGSATADNGIENIGLAVFKNDQFIGTLSKTETLSNLIVTHQLKSCRLSIPDPQDQTKAIDFLLTADSAPQIKVSILNGTPYIRVKVKMNGRMSSINEISDHISDERIAEIEEAASFYLKTHILNYLYKTAKEFKSDISGFGKYAIPLFKTRSDFEEYHWTDKFEDSFFDVDAEMKVRSSFLLTGT